MRFDRSLALQLARTFPRFGGQSSCPICPGSAGSVAPKELGGRDFSPRGALVSRACRSLKYSAAMRGSSPARAKFPAPHVKPSFSRFPRAAARGQSLRNTADTLARYGAATARSTISSGSKSGTAYRAALGRKPASRIMRRRSSSLAHDAARPPRHDVLLDHDAADVIAAEAQSELAGLQALRHPGRLHVQNVLQIKPRNRQRLADTRPPSPLPSRIARATCSRAGTSRG